MVAGEASGDLLASLLLKGLRAQLPADIAYNGIGGARMTEQGFQSNWPMHKLSVNGYVEVLGQLREILAIRKELKQDLL
ncbi:lipid-A-disaccharide synthase, partial [Klebsiella oxytoca]